MVNHDLLVLHCDWSSISSSLSGFCKYKQRETESNVDVLKSGQPAAKLSKRAQKRKAFHEDAVKFNKVTAFFKVTSSAGQSDLQTHR